MNCDVCSTKRRRDNLAAMTYSVEMAVCDVCSFDELMPGDAAQRCGSGDTTVNGDEETTLDDEITMG